MPHTGLNQHSLFPRRSASPAPHYRVVDVETTGYDPHSDAVVEIAWVDLAADGAHVADWSSLVCPGRPIPASASAIHHITDDMVRGAPPFAALWPPPEVEAQGPVLVAHNARFDGPFLGQDPARMVCTMRLAQHLWPGLESYANQFLRYHLGLRVTTSAAHRALDDARVSAALFARELALLREDPVCLSWRPVRIATMPFGRHRGVPLAEVPQDYLRWALQNLDDLSEDLRASMAAALGT